MYANQCTPPFCIPSPDGILVISIISRQIYHLRKYMAVYHTQLVYIKSCIHDHAADASEPSRISVSL